MRSRSNILVPTMHSERVKASSSISDISVIICTVNACPIHKEIGTLRAETVFVQETERNAAEHPDVKSPGLQVRHVNKENKTRHGLGYSVRVGFT